MGGALRFAFERRDDDGLDRFIPNLTRSPDARLVVEPFEPLVSEPLAPDPDGVGPHPDPLSDGKVGQPVGGQKHNPTSLGERVGALAAPHVALQRLSLLGGQNDRNGFPSRHAPANRSRPEKIPDYF